MQHIEEAGIHSGLACSLPPVSIKSILLKKLKIKLENWLALKVKGFMNVQFAIKDDEIYVMDYPRASRTVPFVSKAKFAAC